MEAWPTRLAKLRHATGLSQAKVATAVGIRPASVAQWETGRSRPKPENVPAVALLYGVSIDELCGHDIPRPPPVNLLSQQRGPKLGAQSAKDALLRMVETMDETQALRALRLYHAAFVDAA